MAKKAKPAAPSSAPVTSKNPQSTAPAALCSFTRWEDVSKVVGNPRNPNRHSEDQIGRIVKVITSLGWRAPITVSARSGFVVRGHGRLAAALAAAWTHVPIDVQAYENEAQEWADMIADNRLAELSQRDTDALRELMGSIENVELTGYTTEELARMIQPIAIEDMHTQNGEAEADDFSAFKHKCPRCSFEFDDKATASADDQS